MPACRSPTDFICRSNGPKTRPVARRRMFPRRSRSRPNRRSRLNRSARPARRTYRGVVLTDASYGSNFALHRHQRCTEGTANRLRSRFALGAHRADEGAAGRSAETLLIEWPESEPEPTKYWLATVDEDISFRTKMRYSNERGWPSFPTSRSRSARMLKKLAIPDGLPTPRKVKDKRALYYRAARHVLERHNSGARPTGSSGEVPTSAQWDSHFVTRPSTRPARPGSTAGHDGVHSFKPEQATSHSPQSTSALFRGFERECAVCY
jgi:hypothetical protein